jgi:uncharacterized membrane protein
MNRFASVWRCVLVLVFMLTISHGAFAQVENSATPGGPSDAGTISGLVTDQRGTPLAGSSVVVTTPGGKQVASSTTDGNGIYRVVDLQPGDYVLVVNAKGFHEKKDKVKVKARKTETANIKMKFIPITYN